MQASALNASSSLLNSVDILRFVYENGSSTELSNEKRWEQMEKDGKEKTISPAVTSSSIVEEEKDITSETSMPTNVESSHTQKNNKYKGLQKLLIAAVISNTECKHKENTPSANPSPDEQTASKNVTSNDDKKSKFIPIQNANDNVNTSKGKHNSKETDSTISNVHGAAMECAKDNALFSQKIPARLPCNSYETRVALSDTAQELASSAVQRALTHHILPEERYHRALWQLLKCSHERTHSHRKLDTVPDMNDNYISATNDREEEEYLVSKQKMNNDTDQATEMERSSVSGLALYKSPFADITPLKGNEKMTAEQKEVNKLLSKNDDSNSSNESKLETGEYRNEENTTINSTMKETEKCNGNNGNGECNVKTSNKVNTSDKRRSNNNIDINECDMTKDLKNVHHSEEKKVETTLEPISESITDNISETLVQRYVQCCAVLHTRPLQCVKHVLCKSDMMLAHSISSSESLQNRTSSSPFASINLIERTKLEHDNEQGEILHLPSSSTIILPMQVKEAHQSDKTSFATSSQSQLSESSASSSAGARAGAGAGAITSTTTKAKTESDGEKKSCNSYIDKGDDTVLFNKDKSIEENAKKEGNENNLVETNAPVTPNVQDKAISALPTSTPVTVVPSSPSRSRETENVHKPTQSDTTASSTTSQQPSTLSLMQLISLNFDRCKNLSDARAFVAVLGVLETMPQLYRLCFADTNLSSEQLCTLVLLCEAHLPLLHSLDVSGNMRLDDTAGLAILRLTARRPMLQTVYVDDTNISRALMHQIHTAVKHNRRASKHAETVILE